MRQRARNLYLRARDYALRGLDVSHPGFSSALAKDARTAVQQLKRRDVPQTYWAAASWAAAMTILKDDPNLLADLPIVEALIDRALELDESFDAGAIHSFLISYEMVRPSGEGFAADRARAHFDRAVQLSEGQMAGPYVSLAESVASAERDRALFESSLHQALAINPDARPEWRLVNLIMQQRAAWLLTQVDDLIE